MNDNTPLTTLPLGFEVHNHLAAAKRMLLEQGDAALLQYLAVLVRNGITHPEELASAVRAVVGSDHLEENVANLLEAYDGMHWTRWDGYRLRPVG